MRIPTLIALLIVWPYSAAAADESDFSGVWTTWICPSGIKNDPGKCSHFALELFQSGNKLCGSHMFATAGAARMDEGSAPSLSGEVAGDTATVTVVSGRAPVQVQVEMTLAKGALQWRRLENPSGDYLLPLNTRMAKSKQKTLFAPLFARQLSAACWGMFNSSTPSNVPAQSSSQPSQPAQPAPRPVR